MPIEFERVVPEEIRRLLSDVCKCEGLEPVHEVLDAITEESEGMPRNALFLLQKAADSGKLEKVVESIESNVELVRVLFGGMS